MSSQRSLGGEEGGTSKGPRETAAQEGLRVLLLDLKMEEETMSQETGVAPRKSWRRQRHRFSPRASKRNAGLWAP